MHMFLINIQYFFHVRALKIIEALMIILFMVHAFASASEAGMQRLALLPQSVTIGSGINGGTKVNTLCLDEFQPYPTGAMTALSGAGSATVTRLSDNKTLPIQGAIAAGWVRFNGNNTSEFARMSSVNGQSYRLDVASTAVLAGSTEYGLGDIRHSLTWLDEKLKLDKTNSNLLQHDLWAHRTSTAKSLIGEEISNLYRGDPATFLFVQNSVDLGHADAAIIPYKDDQGDSFILIRAEQAPKIFSGRDVYRNLTLEIAAIEYSAKIAFFGSVSNLSMSNRANSFITSWEPENYGKIEEFKNILLSLAELNLLLPRGSWGKPPPIRFVSLPNIDTPVDAYLRRNQGLNKTQGFSEDVVPLVDGGGNNGGIVNDNPETSPNDDPRRMRLLLAWKNRKNVIESWQKLRVAFNKEQRHIAEVASGSENSIWLARIFTNSSEVLKFTVLRVKNAFDSVLGKVHDDSDVIDEVEKAFRETHTAFRSYLQRTGDQLKLYKSDVEVASFTIAELPTSNRSNFAFVLEQK